ncbi:MAG: type II secretion system protein [Pseudomonadota bacterium]
MKPDRRISGVLRRPRSTREHGFTLVEMSLVLVVIGLILGAVSAGRDLQRNAEYRRIEQRFVGAWEQAYNQYYDRLGVVVGDDPAYPTDVVNFLGITDTGTQDEFRDLGADSEPDVSQANVPQLCGVAPGADASTNTLRLYFEDAGVDLPEGRAFNQEDKFLYVDGNGNQRQVSVCFQWLLPVADGPGAGNTMLLRGLTPDLARTLDSAIDGRVESDQGRFRCVDGDDVTQAACTDWGTNSADDTDLNASVTAAYRMTL